MGIKSGTLVLLKKALIPPGESRYVPLAYDLGVISRATPDGNAYEVQVMKGNFMMPKDDVLPIPKDLASDILANLRRSVH